MKWKATFIEFLIGAILHFAYNVFPYSFVAIIAPINESIFEHLKLVLYPMLLIDIVLWYRYYHKNNDVMTSMLIGIVTGIMSVVLIYYFYRCGLGVNSLIVDILLLFVGILIGNTMMVIVDKHHWVIPESICLLLLAGMILLFSIWTFFPLDLPIFIDPSKKQCLSHCFNQLCKFI